MATSADLPRKYLYKSFTTTGTFIGLIPNVTSKFMYNQLLYTAFTQITIKVGQSADTAVEDVDTLQAEDGSLLTTELGATLTTERQPDMVGSTNSNAVIANDRLIEVWEFSRYWPNGILVFSGYISRWKVNYGGTEDIEVTCLSKGTDLQNYLIPGGTADTLDQSQTQSDGDPTGDFSSWYTSSSPGDGQRYGQTFVVGTGVTNLSAIVVRIGTNYPSGTTPRSIRMRVWGSLADANSGLTALGDVTVVISNINVVDTTFRFATPITVTPGQTVFFALDPDPASTFTDNPSVLNIAIKSANVYSSGSLYRRNSTGGIYSAPFAYDMYFKTYYSVNSTKNTYTSADVATMLNDGMDYYISSGGDVTKSGTYPATGKTATYTFNINTVLDLVQKVQDLGPYNYFWFVDPASNILYYQAAATSADHYLIKGSHFEELDLEATKENIINVVYFTGGDDGTGTGANVYVNVNDTTSLASNRRGLARINDPKVIGTTGAATGRVLAQNEIDSNNAEVYICEAVIEADKYDISLFTLGQMVQPEGFGAFPDRLLLQIVGIKREEDRTTLALGTLRKRATAQVEQIQASLQATQTVDNPNSPS